MRNILVIKLRYIEDVLLGTPVLLALRERFPEARLTMAVNRETENILKWNPDVKRRLVVEAGKT
jgi:ADP-heptose:LPS heptosyltransferase